MQSRRNRQGLLGRWAPIALYALIGGLLVAWWRGAAWLEHLPTVLAVLWVTGGIAWWFRTVVDLT